MTLQSEASLVAAYAAVLGIGEGRDNRLADIPNALLDPQPRCRIADQKVRLTGKGKALLRYFFGITSL